MKLHIAPSKEKTAQEFSHWFIEESAGKETFTVALSGGSTPKVVFDHLAQYHRDMDWSKFHFFWGDERCVSPDHQESNYKMTVDHLFSKIEIPEKNIHRIKGELDPAQEASNYSSLLNKVLRSKNGLPQFDLVILGMGDDGHTASIFPHEIALWENDEPCVVATHPDSGQKRVSITGDIINNAQTVAFLVTGASKAPKVESIICSKGDYNSFPASLVAPVSGDLHWFLDAAAAAGLEK